MARTDRSNVVQYWWDRDVPGLSLLHADFTAHDYPSHTHDAFVIAVTELGSAEMTSRGTVATLCPTALFVSNPEERQSARMGDSRRWRYRSMYLTHEAIKAVAGDLGIPTVPYFTSNLFHDPDLIDGFTRLHHALETRHDSFLEHELLIEAFAALFQRHGSGASRVPAGPRDQVLLSRVAERMQAECAQPLRLGDLAQGAGLTSFQLIRLFQRTVGLTPHDYLIRLRINLACRHLRRGHTLADSAVQAGFYDQSALTRQFKRWYGITPLQFARAARQHQSVSSLTGNALPFVSRAISSP